MRSIHPERVELQGNQSHNQVLWDASMGWWISQHLDSYPDALMVRMSGRFHVARGAGTPEHLEAYRPGTDYMIVILRPVEGVDAFEAEHGSHSR